VTPEERETERERLQSFTWPNEIRKNLLQYGWTQEDIVAAAADGWALYPVGNHLVLRSAAGAEYELFLTAPDTPAKVKALWLMQAVGHSTEIEKLQATMEKLG